MRELILDTETTGLNPKDGHRVIEIGILEVRNKALTGNKFHKYINPERDVPQESYNIHGISSEFLKDKPKFAEIADDLLDFIEGGTLVIHNASFDVRFLNSELSRLKKPSIDLSEVIDTLKLARQAFPSSRASLDALCKRFKIDNSHRQFHGALLDSELLYEVYVEIVGGRQNMFSLEKKENIESKIDKNKTVLDTSVIEPTEEEMAAHRKLISEIQGE